jgi:integrase
VRASNHIFVSYRRDDTASEAGRVSDALRLQLGEDSVFHPHDLRHRRVSLWFRQGVDAVQIASWAGHTPTMSLDVYGHVLVGGEVPVAQLLELLGRRGDDVVMTDLQLREATAA